MRKLLFTTNEYYHVFNRGVEKREICLELNDFQRLLEGMKEFNTPLPVSLKDLKRLRVNNSETKNRDSSQFLVSGALRSRFCKPLVSILSYTLLPNHFHFFLKQLTDNGISEFMQKLGVGFVNYFNKKYGHTGRLFEGTFKAVHIDTDQQLFYLPCYIHLNVLDLLFPEWREGKIEDWQKAKKFLEEYPWSSYRVWLGKEKSPIIKDDILIELFGKDGRSEHKKLVQGWSQRDLEKIKDFLLD